VNRATWNTFSLKALGVSRIKVLLRVGRQPGPVGRAGGRLGGDRAAKVTAHGTGVAAGRTCYVQVMSPMSG